jgi:glucose-6-phosphate isomerase
MPLSPICICVIYSPPKHRITEETLRLLAELARQAGVPAWAERMGNGEMINHTERRSVLHVALRNRGNRPILVNGQDVMPGVNEVLEHMRKFSEQVRRGKWRGHTGKRHHRCGQHRHRRIRPRAGHGHRGAEALWAAGLRMHFVSNVDGTHIAET